METRQYKFRLDDSTDGEGVFSGYASVWGLVEHLGEYMEPGAFTKTLREKPTVPIYWGHEYIANRGAWPLGFSTALEQDNTGLRFGAKFEFDVQNARAAYNLVKAGAVDSVSIGFDIIKSHMKNKIRHITEVRLREISLTPFPADEGAVITAYNSAIDALRIPNVNRRAILTHHRRPILTHPRRSVLC